MQIAVLVPIIVRGVVRFTERNGPIKDHLGSPGEADVLSRFFFFFSFSFSLAGQITHKSGTDRLDLVVNEKNAYDVCIRYLPEENNSGELSVSGEMGSFTIIKHGDGSDKNFEEFNVNIKRYF